MLRVRDTASLCCPPNKLHRLSYWYLPQTTYGKMKLILHNGVVGIVSNGRRITNNISTMCCPDAPRVLHVLFPEIQNPSSQHDAILSQLWSLNLIVNDVNFVDNIWFLLMHRCSLYQAAGIICKAIKTTYFMNNLIYSYQSSSKFCQYQTIHTSLSQTMFQM